MLYSGNIKTSHKRVDKIMVAHAMYLQNIMVSKLPTSCNTLKSSIAVKEIYLIDKIENLSHAQNF